ncbi:MAG: hypothetical protein ACNA7E_10535 [Wenzhouxiangellaceae bacterium]
MPIIAFVIPLIHPASCRRWSDVLVRLDETLRSVAECTSHGSAVGILVANKEAELPEMPAGIHVARIDLVPPATSVFVGEVPEKERRAVKQLDKGKKVLTGCVVARQHGAQYLMTVDADDLVSRRLPGFVAANQGKPGWYVDEGWVLPVGSRWAYKRSDFVRDCGTSLVIRTDLLALPETVEELPAAQISRWFGSHKFICDDLAAQGHTLEAVPFSASVYRTGHAENNTGKGGLRDLYFSSGVGIMQPLKLASRLMRLRRFGPKLQSEFHGGLPPA